jgi:hypothetical protein
MKHILTIVLLLITVLSTGQNYKLFNSSSRKVYTNFPLPDSTFSIAFDSTTLNSGDSVYYNFTQTGNMIISNECQFWGPPECIQQDRPTWLGSKIVFDNISTYKFFTLNSDILNFDFSVTEGDSSLFYQNPTEKFYFSLTKSDTLTVLNYPDSARFYTIIHTDFTGNTIYSPLNQQKIIIAKNLGLVQFFQVDAFPTILNPVYLLGNISPDLGLAKITNDLLYDHSIGDEIQMQVILRYNFPSPDNNEQFIKYTILSKTVTSDSVIYQANRHVFDKGSSTATDDIVDLKYLKNEIISEIPFDYTKPAEFGFFVTKKLYLEDYCGVKMWTFHTNQDRGLRYCIADNCWGSNDVPGPPPLEDTVYTLGLWIFSSIYSDAFMSPPPSQDYSFSSNIIYFKKNGINCGNEAILGIDEFAAPDKEFSMYPVPAQDFLTFEISGPKGGDLIITTINGQQILKRQLYEKFSLIDVSSLKSGIYLARYTSSKMSAVRKFIKE